MELQKKAWLFYGPKAWEEIQRRLKMFGFNKPVVIPEKQKDIIHLSKDLFSEVTINTEAIIIKDCPEKVNFEWWYHFIDRGPYVEKQGQEPFYLSGVVFIFHSEVKPYFDDTLHSFTNRFEIVNCLGKEYKEDLLQVGDIITVSFKNAHKKLKVLGINPENQLYACKSNFSVINISFDYYKKHGVFVRPKRFFDWLDW